MIDRPLLGAALVACALLAYAAGLVVGVHVGERRERLEAVVKCGEEIGQEDTTP